MQKTQEISEVNLFHESFFILLRGLINRIFHIFL